LMGGKIMNWLIALAGASFLLLSLPSSSQAQDLTYCTRCANQASLAACVRCSLNSDYAKQKGFQEAGIRRWCEQWQPQCYARAKKK
jgi:hypothetical protein